MGSTLTCSPLSRKLARRQMSGLLLDSARRMATDRLKLAGIRDRWADIGRRGEDRMRIGLLNRKSLMRRRRCPIGRARKARGNDLRDSDGQQDESDESQAPERRVAAKRAREDKAEKLQRHNASADDAQPDANSPFLGAMLLGLKRIRHRRRVVRRLNLSGQSLRHRREIGPAYGAESPSLSLIRSAFWTEHRVTSENQFVVPPLGGMDGYKSIPGYQTFPPKGGTTNWNRLWSVRESEKTKIFSTLIPPERLKGFSQAALEERHHRHVTVTEQEDEQERDRRVDVAANRVINREDEIEREGKLDVRQQSPLTTVFHRGPQPVVPSAFDVVFRRAHEAGSDSEQSLQHGARV